MGKILNFLDEEGAIVIGFVFGIFIAWAFLVMIQDERAHKKWLKDHGCEYIYSYWTLSDIHYGKGSHRKEIADVYQCKEGVYTESH